MDEQELCTCGFCFDAENVEGYSGLSFQPNPMEVYLIIAWLGWVPNLLIIELLILKKYKYEKAHYFRSLSLPVFVQKGG
jgi:hypothetical protein